MISICCPSRGRPHMIQQVYQSVIDTTSDMKTVELIVAIDDDDPAINQYQEQSKNWENFTLIIGPRTSLGTLYNRMWKISNGNILMITGDDMIFRTKNWNKILTKKTHEYPDQIYFLYGKYKENDDGIHAMYGFVSRLFAETIGYLAPSYLNRYIDTHLSFINDKLKRKIMISILVEHLHHSFKLREKDKTDDELKMKKQNDRLMFKITEYMRDADVALLKSLIKPINQVKLI